jgi:hypothetical protein
VSGWVKNMNSINIMSEKPTGRDTRERQMNPSDYSLSKLKLNVSTEIIREAIDDLERRKDALVALVESEIRIQLRLDPAADNRNTNEEIRNKIEVIKQTVLRDPLTRIDERLNVLRELLKTAENNSSNSKGSFEGLKNQ